MTKFDEYFTKIFNFSKFLLFEQIRKAVFVQKSNKRGLLSIPT